MITIYPPFYPIISERIPILPKFIQHIVYLWPWWWARERWLLYREVWRIRLHLVQRYEGIAASVLTRGAFLERVGSPSDVRHKNSLLISGLRQTRTNSIFPHYKNQYKSPIEKILITIQILRPNTLLKSYYTTLSILIRMHYSELLIKEYNLFHTRFYDKAVLNNQKYTFDTQ